MDPESETSVEPVLQWCICAHLALLSLVLVFSSFPGPACSLGLGALAGVFQPQLTGRLKLGPTLMVHTDPATLRPTARQPPPSFPSDLCSGLPPRSVHIGCGHPFPTRPPGCALSHPNTDFSAVLCAALPQPFPPLLVAAKRETALRVLQASVLRALWRAVARDVYRMSHGAVSPQVM